MPLYPFQLLVNGYSKTGGNSDGLASSNLPGNQDESQEDESLLLHELKRNYTKYFNEEYEPKLPNINNTQPIFPSLDIFIDEQIYETTLDFDFLEHLFDIYIVEGWDGVLAVEYAIALLTKNQSQELSGGVRDKKWPINVLPHNENVWQLAKIFFMFTKNILAIFITETLQNIEKKSAEKILEKLSITNIKTSEPWAKYKIKISKKYSSEKVSWDSPNITVEHTEYSIGDEDLARDLFQLLTKVVEENYNFNNYAKKSQAFRQMKMYSRDESNKRGNDFYWREQYRKDAIDKEEKELRYRSLQEATEKLLTQLRSCILTQHPLGLLIYKFLDKGFEQSYMEHLFGLTLNGLRLDLENVAKEIDPGRLKVEEYVPLTELNASGIQAFDIFSFNTPVQGVEKYLIDNFLNKYKNPDKKFKKLDLSFLPMLSEESLNQLLGDEVIEFDTFEYVVATHYLRTLILWLGEIEQEEEVWDDFWKSISKISAGLSLATLVTPATAEFSPLLRGTAAIADLALMAHAVSSVTGSLKKSDDLLNKSLVALDDFTSETYAQLGEMLSMRKDLADGFDEMLAQEFFNLLIGQRMPIIKELLVARNYYYDIETLADDL